MLALDVGRRRIGLAGCDPLGLTVTPLPALRRGRFPADLAQLTPLVERRRITALVVGLPLDAAQQPTEQAEHCRRYGERLARQLQLPLAFVNEHTSSRPAAALSRAPLRSPCRPWRSAAAQLLVCSFTNASGSCSWRASRSP